MRNTKHIFVTGGVASSLGKGVMAATIGRLLLERGYRITILKLDPYINVDPGTLNPNEHGECYVTADGYECDLDLGHYERFTDIQTTRLNSCTTGRIYQEVIGKERRGEYGGRTVQVVPHITDEIKRTILRAGGEDGVDFVITEIGGTVGDMEGLPFLEAVRQLKWELGRRAVCVHLAYVPYIAAAGELKTKPAQHSVKQLQGYGIQPDIIVLRSEHTLSATLRQKVAGFCNVRPQCVIGSPDAPSIYEIPLRMQEQGLDSAILQLSQEPLSATPPMEGWRRYVRLRDSTCRELHIALIGKYSLQDAYKSITEALAIAGAYHGSKVRCHFIDCGQITPENAAGSLARMDGCIICPGFGGRGMEGKIAAARYCRENNMPTLGICLGMQVMAIEFARNVLGLAEAGSTEHTPQTPHPVIDLMEEQKNVTRLGGTMRLGSYSCSLAQGSRAQAIYAAEEVVERHRHRYELNNSYLPLLEEAGMTRSGDNPATGLTEIIEIHRLRWYIGTQFHPEYSSTVLHPNPIFLDFTKECGKGK